VNAAPTGPRGARAALGRALVATGALPLSFAFAAGVATVFAFAPFSLAGLPVLSLALLLLLWQGAAPGQAGGLGLAFGCGLFGTGVPWLVLALHTYGGMAAPLAVIAVGGLVAYLALFPALAGYLGCRWSRPGTVGRLYAAAAAWTLAEWARSFVLTGFPWLSLGYAQLPAGAATPLAAYAPLGGVFLVTLCSAVASVALVAAIDAAGSGTWRRCAAPFATAAAVFGAGVALDRIEWTAPAGATQVSLLQGNVEQERKFDPEFRDRTYALYRELAAASRGRLVVLPESAFPTFADEVPDAVLHEFRQLAAARGGDVLIGLFTAEAPAAGETGFRYYNSVISVGASPPQLYRKRHLVPFGETIPADAIVGAFIRQVLAIPLASQTPGDAGQPPLDIAGQRVAVNICYEDAFGEEIRTQAAGATLLVNVTNDAWYGRSLAAEQHNQIAAMRAREVGRPLLRATNTGITSAIGPDGRELARLPWFERGVLEIEVVGRRGTTPFTRFGDLPAALLALAILVVASVTASRRRD
jgi:apolipoprotein N-acyltransferase